ncbi:MAG: hypothetical protein LAT82_01800 [Nanoarchaeota archaeon]|nr:hypothetical protein [Nanoarchaeota archaeon]
MKPLFRLPLNTSKLIFIQKRADFTIQTLVLIIIVIIAIILFGMGVNSLAGPVLSIFS